MAAKQFLSGLDLANQRLINLADGSLATDAVTLQQLQAYVRGLSWKAAAICASTANVTLTSPGATIDGVTLAAGNRVLLKNQTTASQNGIYTWNSASTAMTRTQDAGTGVDGTQTLTSGLAVYITEGTVNGDTAWVLTTPDPIVVETTALTFVQFGGTAAPYTAGNGINISSQVISAVVQASKGLSVSASGLAVALAATSGLSVASGLAVVANTGITVTGSGVGVDTTKIPQKYAVAVGDGSSTSITVTHNLGTLDVVVSLYTVSTGVEVETDVVHASTNTITLNFATAPSSGQYRVVVHG